jgi:hypothetical protein
MLYAHLRHSGAAPADIVNTRAIVSVAWIAGPPLATLIIGASAIAPSSSLSGYRPSSSSPPPP